jgi:hypothetical protein
VLLVASTPFLRLQIQQCWAFAHDADRERAMASDYRSLDPARVIDTIAALRQRISERFPGAGLGKVCGTLHVIAQENTARAERISTSNLPLRLLIFVIMLGGAAGLAWIVYVFYLFPRSAENVYTVLQGVEAAANLTVLLGAALFFLFRIEERLKRNSALEALHELRSIVHVIDMHQLTKDPSTVVSVGGKTPSSPARTLKPYELSRYLDYCSEMMSLTSKVAVLFAQSFPDPVVTEAVSDIERIAAGLSQKIWQKIMIIDLMIRDAPLQVRAAAAQLPQPGLAASRQSGAETAP